MTLILGVSAFAQTKADAILGDYYVKDAKNGDSKVRFTKNAQGTYDCKIIWIKDPIDPKTGQPWKDFRNPDKSLRDKELNGAFLVRGLVYDPSGDKWSGAKIYDPNRGIKANATMKFSSPDKLEVSGKVLGIGEKQIWDKL